MAFLTRLLAVRKAHAPLRCQRYLHANHEPAPGVADIAWFDERGEVIGDEAWQRPEERTLTVRRAAENEGGVTIIMLLLNPTEENRAFKLPGSAEECRVLIESAAPEAPERDLDGAEITVGFRSVTLLAANIRKSS